MKKPIIYLDFAATTPVDPRVLESMMPYFSENFGNSSSVHFIGQQADHALAQARETISSLLNCSPGEVVFTSCGSESDNLALRGTAFWEQNRRHATHILISPVEHHAVSQTATQLAKYFNFNVEYLPVDCFGMVDPDDVAKLIRPETALVSVIYANNEIGTINPISDIGKVCRQKGIPFHTDAVQAAAHLSINVNSQNIDLLSIGAHKFYGPKGIGVLFKQENIGLLPTQTGGGQEFGLRAGTHNIPYIIGMAQAFTYAQTDIPNRNQTLSDLRDYLIGNILEEIPDCQLTGHPTLRLPNHASFVFNGVDGNRLLMMLDVEGFACSSGSACKTGDPEPSEVLLSIGLSNEWALGSLRVTIGNTTTIDDINNFIVVLPKVVEKSRRFYG